jgi:hypothetical protein
MNIGKERLATTTKICTNGRFSEVCIFACVTDSWIAVDIKIHVRIALRDGECGPQTRTVYFETIARPPMICSPSKVSKLCSRCGRHGPGTNRKGELSISCQ